MEWELKPLQVLANELGHFGVGDPVRRHVHDDAVEFSRGNVKGPSVDVEEDQHDSQRSSLVPVSKALFLGQAAKVRGGKIGEIDVIPVDVEIPRARQC